MAREVGELARTPRRLESMRAALRQRTENRGVYEVLRIIEEMAGLRGDSGERERAGDRRAPVGTFTVPAPGGRLGA